MFDTCPSCQVGRLRPIRTTYAHIYDDTLIQMPNIAAWKCDVCGETFYDPDAVRRIEVLVGEAGPPPNRHIPTPAPTGNELPAAADEVPRPRPK
jgi:YgiT-type zinc finger domain-containing protein